MPHFASCTARRLFACGLFASAAILSSLLLTKNVDFRVYWHAGHAFLSGSHPLYGPKSGIGYPMHYRYPPATYLLLWPLSLLPLYWAGVIWVLGAWAAVTAAVALAVRSLRVRITRKAWGAAFACTLAYIVLAVRYGNVQPYVIAAIFMALLLAESRQFAAACLMTLAITFKIWPVFFLPWFLPRGRRAVLLWILPVMASVWLIPLVRWPPAEYLALVQQWFHSELCTATTASELWYFPGQSLRGILFRYLALPRPWAEGFPDIHILALPSKTIAAVWLTLGLAAYAGVCTAVLRSGRNRRWVWDGASFALFTLLQPLCAKSSMVSLVPAVVVGAALYSRRPGAPAAGPGRIAARLYVAAGALSLLGALVQVRWLHRLLLTIGTDFYAALLLMAALVLWARPSASRRRRAGRRPDFEVLVPVRTDGVEEIEEPIAAGGGAG